MIIKNKKWKNLITVTLLFTIAVLSFEIIPRFIDIIGLSVSLVEDSNKLNNIESIEENLVKTKVENKNLKLKMNKVVSDYKKDKNISDTMRNLNEIANRAKINISSINPQNLKKSDKLWLQSIELKFNSTYEQFFNFVCFLEHSQKVILLNEVNIKPKVIAKSKLDITAKIDVYLNL